MANAFKNITVSANHAADTDIDVGSTIASGATHTIIGMSIANITSGVIAVDVIIENAANTPTRSYVLKAGNVPVGSSILVAGGDQKIVLWYHSTGDQLIVRSNTLNSTNITLSYLEST